MSNSWATREQTLLAVMRAESSFIPMQSQRRERNAHSESQGSECVRRVFQQRIPSTSTVPWHLIRQGPAGCCSQTQRNEPLATSRLARSVLRSSLHYQDLTDRKSTRLNSSHVALS